MGRSWGLMECWVIECGPGWFKFLMRVTEVENQGKVCDRKWTHWLWVAWGIPRGLVLLAVGHGRLKLKGKVQDLSLTISVSSVQFSHSVVSDSLLPHGLYHARLPCPSPTPGAYSNSCPSSWWCHPTISSCRPLLLPPSILHSIRVFSNESVWKWTMYWVRWPKYWSFSFSISPSNEYSGLISFRMDWLDLFVIQGTLKSLLHHHSSKASILRHSTFFIVQLSHLYTTTGKTINLTRQTFVGEVMSLLFNMLSKLVRAFLPRSKCLLISWLQSPSAVILEPPKIKSLTVSTVSPSIAMKW